jgi:hypothetical protein
MYPPSWKPTRLAWSGRYGRRGGGERNSTQRHLCPHARTTRTTSGSLPLVTFDCHNTRRNEAIYLSSLLHLLLAEKNDSVVDRRSSIERSVIRLAAEQEVALAVAVDIPTSVTCPIPRTLHPLTAFLVHAAPGCVLVMHHNTTEHQAANKSKGHRYTLPWHIAPMHGSPTTSWRKERIHNRQEC